MGTAEALTPDESVVKTLSAAIMRSGLAFIVIRLDGTVERYAKHGGRATRVS